MRKLTDLGWAADKVDYPFFYKTYPAHRVRAALLPGDGIRGFDTGEDFLIDTLCFSPSPSDSFDHFSPIPIGKVAVIAFSEAVRDLTLFLKA